MFCATEPIKMYVLNTYLGLQDNGLTEGYLVGVTAIAGRPLGFTVHLQTGALFSRLPIEAIRCDRFGQIDTQAAQKTHELQPWSCLEGPAQAYVVPHLRNYAVKARVSGQILDAHYLFTVDYMGDGLADDPEQFKTHNIVVLTSGQIAALPNNHVLFVDKYFTEDGTVWPRYSRQTKRYFAG